MTTRLWPAALFFAAACGDDVDTLPEGGGGHGGEGEGGSAETTGGGGSTDVGGSPAGCPDAVEIDPSPATGQWSDVAPMLQPRQETAVVAMEGLVYVLGGFTLVGTTDLAEVYDPEADEWRAIAPLPVELHHPNAAAVDGKLYVLGYLVGGAFAEDGSGWVYDPETDEWSPVAKMPEGTERGAGAVGVIDGRVIVAGGFRGLAAVSDASLYDPVSDSWQTIAPLPVERDHGAGAVVDDVFFAIGGREGAIESQSPRVFSYDRASDTWCERSSLPTARGGIAAAVIDGQIVVVGGEGNPDDPNGVFSNVEVFTPSENRWRIEAPLPAGRHGTGAASVGDVLYLPGGANEQAFGAVATHTRFSL